MKEDLQDLESQSLATQASSDNKLDNQNKLKIILFILAGIAILLGTFYAGMKFSTKKEISRLTKSEIVILPTPTSAITVLTNNEEASRPITPLKPRVANPATFGFTKTIDLPGIGIRAVFPENIKITYTDPKIYYMVDDPYGTMYFWIYDYSGGSRRAWFREKVGYPESVFESFGANNHMGYLSYSTDSSGNLYALYYFSTVKTNKMLVVNYSAKSGKLSLEKFKSFISAIQIIEPNLQGIQRQDQVKFETQRWSDLRKTVWERSDLGLRITTPEWIENRMPNGKKDDGTWNYTEWVRLNPDAKTDERSVYVTGHFMGGSKVDFLDSKYAGKNFVDVVNELLPAAGYCKTEWKKSKSQCSDVNPDYCYTRDEVVQSLVMRKTAKFGPYVGQLRGINASFSQKRDCRGEDIWLIQVKDGHFVLSTIYPDAETIRLEGF